MPFETYTDPETGEKRRRWVAPKQQAKPAAEAKPPAQSKPKDSGFDLGGAVNSLVKNTAQVLTNPAAAALPVMGLVKQATESPVTQGVLESVGRTVLYGGRQLLQEGNDYINDELAKTGLTQRTTAQKPDAPFLGIAPLPKVETQHPAEAIIGNILGYGAGFLLTRRAMGAVGSAAAPVAMRTPLAPALQQAQRARAGVQALRNTPLPAAGQAGRGQALAKRATGFAIEEGATGSVAGALTTYALQDPWSGNFSDLLKGTPLESPFSRYTQSNPNDKAEEARFKNAVTDWVYGIPVGIGFGGVGEAIKAATAKFITKTAKHAAVVDNAAAQAAAPAPAATQTVDVAATPVPVRITGRNKRATETYADMRREPLWEQKGVEIQEQLGAGGRVEPTMIPEAEVPPGAALMDDPWGDPTVAQARKELEDAQVELQNEVAKETYSTPTPVPLAEGQIPELAPPSFDELATLPPSSIQVDPRRFQFKAEGQTKTGQSGSLSDTEAYNPDLANVISVWRDPADGQVYVVNGHNRLARANRSDAPGINVRFIQAADAAEARTKGAMQNISEEKGTPVDAAKVMRDSGMGPAEMVQAGVSPSSRVMADAVPLSRLPQNLFDRLATGKLEQSKAVALGSVEGLDDQVVNDVAAEAIKRKWSAAKIEQAMQEARFAQTQTVDDELDLLKILGDEWATKTSNFNQLLDIRTEAFRLLREEMVALASAANVKRTGYLEAAGNVINVAGSKAAKDEASQSVAVFNRVTGYVGPVRDLLNEMAGQVKGKVTAKQVVTDNLERLRTAIQEEINGPRLPMEDAAAPVARAADEVTAPVTEVAAPTARQLSPEDKAKLDQALKVLPKAKRDEVIAQLESGEPLGNPTPIGEPPILQTAEPFTLPAELQRSAPRYSYGSKQFQLEFASDLDKTAYILANDVKTVSKAAPKFRAAVEAAGLNLKEIAAHGDQVRAAIKQQAKDAEPGVIRLPDQGFGRAQLNLQLPNMNLRLGEGLSQKTRLTWQQQEALREEVFRIAGDEVQVDFPVEITGRLTPEQAAAYGRRPGDRYDAGGMYESGGNPVDDVILAAMNYKGRPVSTTGITANLYHEAFHRLQRVFLTDQELGALRSGDKQIRELAAKVVASDPGLAKGLLDGSVESQEAEAIAFSGWWKYGNEYEKATWAEPFKKLAQITEAAINWLKGNGYQTWDDVFERTMSGEVAERGYRPEFAEPEPTVQLSVQPPDPEEFIRRLDENIEAIRSGEMDMQEAMSSDVRRLVSRSGKTAYRSSAPEELIASNRALHDMLRSRAEATGRQSFNVNDVFQEAARRLSRDNMSVDLTIRRHEAARAGDPRSTEDLIAHAALILHRDEAARQNGIAAIEFLNNTDEGVKADAMRRLWAGMEDQTRLDVAYMTSTRRDAQHMRLSQGPERVVFVNAQEMQRGTILRHGTSPESGEAILRDGFQPTQQAVGIMGKGTYFTTTPHYTSAYGDVEVYGDLPADIRILDLVAMDKPVNEFLRDINLGKVDREGLLGRVQKDGIREWAEANGYQGIRFSAEFDKAATGVDEIVLFDTNAANRVVGSDAAVVPTPDLPDQTVQQIVDQELSDPANSLLDKIDPEVRADIENGVLGPDAEAMTEALSHVAIASRDTKGAGPRIASKLKAVPTGYLTQDLILQANRSSLLWSMATAMKMLIGSSYRTMTLGADQAIASLGDAALQGVKGNGRGAANAVRRAGLDMGIYLRIMGELPNAFRLAGHSLKEGESFGNLGRTQMEIAQKGFTEADQQMALEGAGMVADQQARRTTLDNPFFLNPENKNMTAQAMRAGWKTLSFSGRVAGTLDTLFSSLVGPSAEWARLMDLQLRQAEDLGMRGTKAWTWASDKTEELLEMQWAKVVTEGGKTIEKAALTGKHAQTAMDWVNFTDPLDVKFQERSYEYGIRVAKDEGLTDSSEIARRAEEWMNETPDAWRRAGLGAARLVSAAPRIFESAVNNTPLLGLLQAFNRGPTNIIKAGGRATGFLSPFIDTFQRDIYSEDVMTRDRAMGEIATGWLTAVTAVTLATSGYVELTGPDSLNPQVRQKMRNEGWRPFAIRFRNPSSGEWTPYFDLTPVDTVSSIFAGVGSYLSNANNMPTENREAFANNFVLTVAETVRQVGVGQFTKGMYGGIMQIFDMFSDLETKSFIPVEGQIGAFEEYVQRKLTSFMPAVFRNIRRGADPYERVVVPGDWPYPFNFFQEVGQRFQNEIPGMSGSLAPRLHPLTASPILVSQVWGTQYIPADQPWLRGLVHAGSPTAGVQMTAGSPDPVDNELRRLSGRGTAFIIWNANEFQIPNYRLDQNKLNRLAEITRDLVPPGRSASLHGSLSTMITGQEYQALPEATPGRATQSSRAIRLNEEINYYKPFIKERFRMEDPDLDARLRVIEKQKGMNQNDAQMGIEAWTRRINP